MPHSLPIRPGAIHANPEPTDGPREPRSPRAAAGTLLAPLLSGCWVGAGGGGSGGDAINVLMVNNPQMVELQKLTAAHFTEETGIKVNFTVLPENDVRDKISQDFANQAGQYDVATLSNYEIPIYARNGWLKEMDSYVAEDPAYDERDILKPMRQSLTGDDGKLYGQPFYGESSFLMYRKDVFARAGPDDARTPHLAAGRGPRGEGRRRRSPA
ncbi:hypothetical protein SGLAM104S_10664 [Streptomyces glaucescens]